MLNTIKSFKLVFCVALLALAAACTPYQTRQLGIYGPPVAASPNVAPGDCNAALGVACASP